MPSPFNPSRGGLSGRKITSVVVRPERSGYHSPPFYYGLCFYKAELRPLSFAMIGAEQKENKSIVIQRAGVSPPKKKKR